MPLNKSASIDIMTVDSYCTTASKTISNLHDKRRGFKFAKKVIEIFHLVFNLLKKERNIMAKKKLGKNKHLGVDRRCKKRLVVVSILVWFVQVRASHVTLRVSAKIARSSQTHEHAQGVELFQRETGCARRSDRVARGGAQWACGEAGQKRN